MVDGFVELLDEEVHIVTTPITTIANAIIILTILGIVWNRLTSSRIRVEIVVHVDAVDVVAGDDVTGNFTDIVAILRDAGV